MPEPTTLTVTREVDNRRVATFTISFPPDQPPQVVFDTMVWVGMSWQDVECLRTLQRERGFHYRYSITNYVELLSRLARGPAPGWDRPFEYVRAAFRKIRTICEPAVLPSPEMEYLQEVGLSRLLHPNWVPDTQQTAIAVELVARAQTLGDITGQGVQSSQAAGIPRWILDPNHYLRLTRTDDESITDLIQELSNYVTAPLTRENIESIVPWFIKLAGFFLLFRPSSGMTHLSDLPSEEQNRFVAGFTYGAGRVFKSHCVLMAHNAVNVGRSIDPNDLYDALQLLALRHPNRLFVTNERSFFRYQEDPNIQRVVPWEAFKQSHGQQA